MFLISFLPPAGRLLLQPKDRVFSDSSRPIGRLHVCRKDLGEILVRKSLQCVTSTVQCAKHLVHFIYSNSLISSRAIKDCISHYTQIHMHSWGYVVSVTLSMFLPKCCYQISKENNPYPIIQQCFFFFFFASLSLQNPFIDNSELQQRTARMLSLNTWDVAVALTNFDWTIFDSVHEVCHLRKCEFFAVGLEGIRLYSWACFVFGFFTARAHLFHLQPPQ